MDLCLLSVFCFTLFFCFIHLNRDTGWRLFSIIILINVNRWMNWDQVIIISFWSSIFCLHFKKKPVTINWLVAFLSGFMATWLPSSYHSGLHSKKWILLSSHLNLYLQGQSRRVQVEVRSVPDSGTMPLITASILSVSIGDVKIQQARLSKGGGSQWVRRKSVIICWTRDFMEMWLP